MGGTLVHSREFRQQELIGSDGKLHFELVAVDGGSENCSFASWQEIKQLASAYGVPESVWPELLEYEFSIDVPLDTVILLQRPFRNRILQLPDSVVMSHRTLLEISQWLAQGEMVYLCGC